MIHSLYDRENSEGDTVSVLVVLIELVVLRRKERNLPVDRQLIVSPICTRSLYLLLVKFKEGLPSDILMVGFQRAVYL